MRSCTSPFRTFISVTAFFAVPLLRAQDSPMERTPIESAAEKFLTSIGAANPESAATALDWIDANWSDELLPYFIEIYRFTQDTPEQRKLLKLLRKKIGQKPTKNFERFNQYVWSQDLTNSPDYAYFKQLVHRGLDPAFENYFTPDRRFDIRLDEVTWGGVKQDGIPPLRQPAMIPAADADYLAGTDVVFGIEIDGEARAYPQRILAWHEMFVDTIAGVPLVGVYCTLCGTVILYETSVDGTDHELGTSGFLYRSNKLMYDRATQSLWSTMKGKPVIGPLAGSGIELPTRSIVTTSWSEWRRRHPDTQVLALETGFDRDYNEGVAYRDYFNSDDRMFQTPFADDRLEDKEEVLALRFTPEGETPVAISASFLKRNRIYEDEIGGQTYVILTDASRANRVYERPANLGFVAWDKRQTATDHHGVKWTLTEAALTAPDGRTLERLPAHRAFWFGWHGAFPDTVLIK
jgi:hypothetical protein